jgi:DNA polymerase-3 subunit beta
MKFTALREDLMGAVQTVQFSSDSKGMMPILSGVKIESSEGTLTFYTTDLESYTITKSPANIEEDGECVVNLKIFGDYLKDSSDEKVTVSVVGNEMVLQGENSLFKLFTMPPEDFPNSPDVNIPLIEELEVGEFIPAVLKVSKAASKDEKRPTLLGILLEIESDGLNMVSTDSYRLAMKKIKGGFSSSEKGQLIIPSAAMVNLSRIVGKKEKVGVYRDENKGQIRFSAGDSDYMIRLIEGKFPKYSQFIPETMEGMVEVEKEELISAIKRVSLISSTIRLKISEEGVTLISESREVGEGREKISSNYSGEEIDIAFNSRFFEDGITSIDGEKIVLAISEPLKPGIVKEKEGEDFMYIIMPIRL